MLTLTNEMTTSLHRKAQVREPHVRTKRAVFQQLTKNPLPGIAQQLQRFLSSVAESNMGSSRNFLIPFSPTPMGAETASLPTYRDVLSAVRQRRSQECSSLAQTFEAALQKGQEQKLFGEIQWFSEDTCRFTYYRGFADRQSDRIIHRHLKFTHDVMDAELWYADEGGIALPKRVQKLVDSAPAVLLPHLVVVGGVEIVHRTQEVGQAVELLPVPQRPLPFIEQQYRLDPALIIGDYVLTGWIDGEE